MKKITFIEKDDSSSYDPVSTFFHKTKPLPIAKTSQNSASHKKPIQKNNQPKNQQKATVQSISHKIGQKAGSGLIPRKAPNYNPNQYQKQQGQTIYNYKQKQEQLTQNILKTTISQKNNITEEKKNSKRDNLVEKKPDMVFDTVKKKGNQEDMFQVSEHSKLNHYNKLSQDDQEGTAQKNQNQSNKKLPGIKSPINHPILNKRNSSHIKTYNPQTVSSKLQTNKIGGKSATNQIKQQKKNQINREKQQFNQNNQVGHQSINIPFQSIKNEQKTVAQTKKTTEKYHQSLLNKNLKNQQHTNPQLQDRIKQLQNYQKEYQQRINQLQTRIQFLVKTQQKYQKLLKDHKLCASKNKQYDQIFKQLQDAKQSINRLISSPNTPYSFKREYLLLNQIKQLKKTNRDLVLRIKNYKGSDFVQMAMSKNKEEIARQLEIQYEEKNKNLNVQLENNLSSLVNMIYNYLERKSGKNEFNQEIEKRQKKNTYFIQKVKFPTFQQEQKFLVQISSVAQNLSLTLLSNFSLIELPKSNQDAINLYAQIENQRQNIFAEIIENSKIITKQEINFAITENNLQIINDIQENNHEIQNLQNKILNTITPEQKSKEKNSLASSMIRPRTSYNTSAPKNVLKQIKKKVAFLLDIFKKRSLLSTGFHIQSICYFTLLKQIMTKKLSKLYSQLTNLYGRLKQMKDIFDLGGATAKQSLYLYLQANLDNFCLIIPNFKLQIQQIKSTYREISTGMNKKISIRQG